MGVSMDMSCVWERVCERVFENKCVWEGESVYGCVFVSLNTQVRVLRHASVIVKVTNYSDLEIPICLKIVFNWELRNRCGLVLATNPSFVISKFGKKTIC